MCGEMLRYFRGQQKSEGARGEFWVSSISLFLERSNEAIVSRETTSKLQLLKRKSSDPCNCHSFNLWFDESSDVTMGKGFQLGALEFWEEPWLVLEGTAYEIVALTTYRPVH